MLKSGKKVTNPVLGWNQSCPEMVEDFDREICCCAPKTTPKVKWEVVRTTNEVNGEVPVITKKLVGHVDNSGICRSPSISA